jgi:hypothetical protein
MTIFFGSCLPAVVHFDLKHAKLAKKISIARVSPRTAAKKRTGTGTPLGPTNFFSNPLMMGIKKQNFT